jgi:nicotinamide-nucleotide amidase
MSDSATGDRLVDRLPDDIEDAVKALLQKACDRSLTIATAESCTGGLICALLTDVEGCSHAFERGFIAYSPEAKTEMLSVSRPLIDQKGAVSREVALEMLQGALKRSSADIALAVTGFAGPAAPGDEPGLVHFACSRRGRLPAHRELHLGDIGRAAVRLEAVRTAIAMMMAELE